MAARGLSMGLGFWLLVSALAWPDATVQFDNSLIAGVLIMTFAVAALMGRAIGQYLNAASGAWLIVSIVVLPPLSGLTALNLAIVGVALVVLALWPRQSEPHFVGSLISGPQ